MERVMESLFKTVSNARELGGMITASGKRIKSGALIRSGQLGRMDDADLKALNERVGLVIDLRDATEAAELPDRIPADVDYLELPILEDLAAGISRDQRSDEEIYKSLLKDPESSRLYMCSMYRQFVVSSHSRAQYRIFLKLLKAYGGSGKAVLWHCSAGKDRAGIAAMLVEHILGVSWEDMLKDYLLTNEYRAASLAMKKEDVKKLRADFDENAEKALEYMYSAREDYLEAFFEAAERAYGSLDAYIVEGLDFDPSEQEMLRLLYLE
jgi:protein-tyrosine phosphatase